MDRQTVISCYKQLYSTLKELYTKPAEAWSTIAVNNDSPKSIYRSTVLPLIILSAITTLIFKGLYSGNWAIAVVNGLLNVLVLFTAYFANIKICKFEAEHHKREQTTSQCAKIIAYPFTVSILVNIIMNIFPSCFFFYILLALVVMQLYYASTHIITLREKERDIFIIVNSVAVIGTPLFINSIVHKILVNI